MSSYTPAQKRAWSKKMSAAKAAKVSGFGAYKRKAPAKRTARRPASAAVSARDGWLAEGLGSIGNMLMPGLGGQLGRGAGSLIKSITGFGDYEVKENSLLVPEAGDPPMIVNSASKSVIIRHREYIDDIVSSATPGAFAIQNFYINPGDRITFPWLSQMADSFEHYRVRGMIYEFRTMSSDALNSTNTALGQVIMATSYNSALPNFTNKYEMENYEFGCSVKPSSSLMHPIECAKSQSVLGDLYVRPTINVPDGSDRRLYDFGNFQIATNGLQGASVNVGELWVTYEIELFKPKVITEDGTYIPYVFAEASFAQTGNVTILQPFGTITGGVASALDSASTVQMTNSVTSLIFHNMPIADYRLQVAWRGSTSLYACTNCTWVTTGASSQTDVTFWPQNYSGSCDSFVAIVHFRVSQQNTQVVCTPTVTGILPTGSLVIAELVQVPYGGGS